MDNFKQNANKNILYNATIKMINDKYSEYRLSNIDIQNLIDENIKKIIEDKKCNNLNIKELNHNYLKNIKYYFDNINKSENIKIIQKQVKTNDILNEEIIDKYDEDIIQKKLRDLELQRTVMPSINEELIKNSDINTNTDYNNISTSLTPININLSNNTFINRTYKTLIINSISREWYINANRNNLNFNLSLDIKKNIFYPVYICFPNYISNITPYVRMNITDNIKNIYYTFICIEKNKKWDTWGLIENNVENISLNNIHWSIKFYDFMNNELNIGYDNINIIEIDDNMKDDNIFILTLELDIYNDIDIINKYDDIMVRTFNGDNIKLKVIDILEYNKIKIIDISKNLKIDDLRNSKILIIKNQYSLIIKYNLL